MEIIFSDLTVSMSEFKKNPASVLRRSQHRPVAVLNHNKAAFYLIEPHLYQAMLNELTNLELRQAAHVRPSKDPQDKGPAYRAVLERLGKMAESMAPASTRSRDN